VSTQLGREVGKLHRDHGGDVFGFSGKVKNLYYADQITFNFARVSVVTNQVSAIDMSNHGPMEISGPIGASALKQCTVPPWITETGWSNWITLPGPLASENPSSFNPRSGRFDRADQTPDDCVPEDTARFLVQMSAQLLSQKVAPAKPGFR
jgi:hypothetical protein